MRRGGCCRVAGECDRRRFRFYFCRGFFFQIFQYGEIVGEYFQSHTQHILEFLDVTSIFRIIFRFRRRHVGKFDEQGFCLGTGGADFFDIAHRFFQESDILQGYLAGFCQVVKQVFDCDQCINNRHIGFGKGLLILRGKFGKQQRQLLQLGRQLFQSDQSGHGAVMHQLFCCFMPRLFRFDRLDLQDLFAQGFKELFANRTGIAHQFFDFQLARMFHLRLQGFRIIIGGFARAVFLQLFQRFLHQNQGFGHFNPLGVRQRFTQFLIDLGQ